MKKDNIIIVDDERGVRESLKMILRDRYNLSLFAKGEEVLKKFTPDIADVALVDIKMPGMDGVELLKKLKEIDPDFEIIMITGYGTLDTATQAIRLGASGYINKPFDKSDLLNIIEEKVLKRKKRRDEKKKLMELKNIQSSLNKRMKQFYSSTVDSLLAAIHAKDGYTSDHSQQVAHYSTLIVEACNSFLKLTSDEKEIFRYVASLHDIGKIGIPESIIGKKGGLTSKEWRQIKKHPEIGCFILTPIDGLKNYMCIVRHHHERYDGTGYPTGKKGDKIPLFASIVAIADAYHAMRSDRPYHKSMSKEEALRNLKKEKGGQFHPEILEIAMKVFREHD